MSSLIFPPNKKTNQEDIIVYDQTIRKCLKTTYTSKIPNELVVIVPPDEFGLDPKCYDIKDLSNYILEHQIDAESLIEVPGLTNVFIDRIQQDEIMSYLTNTITKAQKNQQSAINQFMASQLSSHNYKLDHTLYQQKEHQKF